MTPDGTSTLYIGQWYEESQDGGKRVRTNYYYLGGQRVALRRGTVGQAGVVYWLHVDHLGSTSEVSGATGSLVGRERYYPYGQVRYSSGTLPTTYNFTGQRLDNSTGLLYYGARYYDPTVGRFIQADTLVPQPDSPQSLNRYSYTLNNPLKYIDPSGHVYIIGTTPEYGLLFAGPGCGCNLGTQVYGSGDELANTMKLVATAVDMTPVVGDAKGFVEAFTGHDLITGDDLGNWRWLGLLGASELRYLRKVDDVIPEIGRQLELGGDFAKIVGRAALKEYVKTLPIQTHHILTWTNSKWTAKFEQIVGRYGRGLDEAWNKVDIHHLGSHPEAYHQWVFDQLQEIDKIANGDWATFLKLFNERIRQVVESNPEMLIKEWWLWE